MGFIYMDHFDIYIGDALTHLVESGVFPFFFFIRLRIEWNAEEPNR